MAKDVRASMRDRDDLGHVFRTHQPAFTLRISWTVVTLDRIFSYPAFGKDDTFRTCSKRRYSLAIAFALTRSRILSSIQKTWKTPVCPR